MNKELTFKVINYRVMLVTVLVSVVYKNYIMFIFDNNVTITSITIH